MYFGIKSQQNDSVSDMIHRSDGMMAILEEAARLTHCICIEGGVGREQNVV